MSLGVEPDLSKSLAPFLCGFHKGIKGKCKNLFLLIGILSCNRVGAYQMLCYHESSVPLSFLSIGFSYGAQLVNPPLLSPCRLITFLKLAGEGHPRSSLPIDTSFATAVVLYQTAHFRATFGARNGKIGIRT